MFEIAPTHLYIGYPPFIRWRKKKTIREEGEGKKLKGDGRSIGQEEKREGAQAQFRSSFFLRLLAERPEPSLSVATATSSGTRWPGPRYYPRVAYALSETIFKFTWGSCRL
jgi:hypothetical protein